MSATATTTVKPRSLILRPHEARRLAETGEALIVRDVKPQPVEAGSRLIGLGPGEFCWTPENRLFRCPFGPVGSPLVGKEGWAKSPKSVIYRIDHDRGDGFGSQVIDFATGEMIPLIWMSPTAMPLAASRFPRLIHAACEVKRVADATWEDVAAIGLPDQPRQIVKPGSSPIEYISFDPHHVVTRFTQIAAETWAWFSLVRNAEHESEAADG